MNTGHVIRLAELYEEYSGSARDRFLHAQEKEKYAYREIKDYNDFFKALVDIGGFDEYVFLPNHISIKGFDKLTSTLSFPIITFKRGQTLAPVIIFPKDSGRGFNAFEVLEGEQVSFEFNAVGRKSANLCTVGEMINQFGMIVPAGMDWERHKNDIFFIAGFDINSFSDGPFGAPETKTLNPWRKGFRMLKTESKEIGHVYFYSILIGLVNLALPLGIQSIINLISGGVFINSVIVLMIVVIIAVILAGVLQIIQISAVERMQQRIFARAAYEFSFRFPRMRMESIMGYYPPELANRFFDVVNIQKSLPKLLIELTAAVIQIFFGLVLLAFYHPFFIFFGTVLLLALFFLFRFTGPLALSTSIKESTYKYETAYWIEELGRTMGSFKLGGISNFPVQAMDSRVYKWLKARKAHFRILLNQFIAIVGFKTIVTSGLLILGSYLVVERAINLGQFVAAEIIIVLVIGSVEKLISTLEVIYDFFTSVEKISKISEIPLEQSGGIRLSDLDLQGPLVVSTKNLSYQYPHRSSSTLSNINFNAPAGYNVGVCGYSGSGKSTLLRIISGLLQDYKGVLTINGIPVRNLNLIDYRGLVGDILEESQVFEGNIEDNITMGRPGVDVDNLLESVNTSGLDRWVNESEAGFYRRTSPAFYITEVPLTRRILIARGLVDRPKMLIVDDFFFNMPRHIKMNLVNQILSKKNDRTTIIASNDTEILKQCDLIYLMDKGAIFASGSFAQLTDNQLFNEVINS